MKKFLILSYSITGMGGGQMYQYNKLKFMKEHGYETYVFYAVPGEIVISDFFNIAEVKNFDLINTNPCIVGKRICKQLIEKMMSVIGEADELIIECNNKTTSLWGELLAQRTSGFSYSLIIDEKIGSIDSPLLDFFTFKRNKNELKGLKMETYEMIFKSKKLPEGYNYCLPIAGNNVVADIEYQTPSYMQNNYNLRIGSIGRLDKAYVPTLIDQIIIYAQRNTDKKILFGMIGDSPESEDRNRIIDKIKNVPNLDLQLYGSMYPIPKKLLNDYDVFISSAGSARVTGNLGIPTITIDARDYMAIGIFQYDTDQTVFRQTEPDISISEKLEDTIINYDDVKEKLSIIPSDDFEAIFGEHLKYYNSHLNDYEYYNVLKMKLSKGKLCEKIVYKVFGKRIYNKIRKQVFLKKI